MTWLDTQTKEILRRETEPKLAPPKAAEFGLILLRKGGHEHGLVRAICRINKCQEDEALNLVRSTLPAIINPGLTEDEALYGQFELICCDAVAAFVRSEVLLQSDEADYLSKLFGKILQSPEFKPTRLDVVEIPATEAGRNFVDQFLSAQLPAGKRSHEFSLWVPFKKARIMKHWAERVGAKVECDAVQEAKNSDLI